MTEFSVTPVIDPTDETFLVGAEGGSPSIWNKYRGNKYLGCVPYGHICVTTTDGKKLFKTTEDQDNVDVIESAYAYADLHLPMVDIEFGVGFFDIIGGTVYNPDSTNPDKWGLTIRGQGKSTVMRFIGPNVYSTGEWFAIRIKPVSTPALGDFDNYLHGFSITNMSAFDEAPYLHASNPGEETHGFNIQYCVGASLSNNNLYNIGDEGIEADFCHGVHLSNNYCFRCNIAEEGGGAGISCKNGSGEVVIVNNVITDNIPDAWDINRTYFASERTRGSDQRTYKSIAGGNIGNDPAGGGSPGDWIDLSVGEGPLNYGIDIKLASAIAGSDVTNVTITGNTIARIETSGYRIANTENNTANIAITGGSIDSVDYAISKTGRATSNIVISGIAISNVRKNVIDTVNSQGGSDNDKDWLISNLVVDGADGHFLGITNMDGLKVSNCKVKNVAGAIISVGSSTKVKILNNEFEDCGNVSQIAVRNTSAKETMEFSGNKVINCDSNTRFIDSFDIINDNELDLLSPFHFSVDNFTEFNRNIMNGGIRQRAAGPVRISNNTFTIAFDLAGSAIGVIGIDGGATISNAGSRIQNNTMTNNSSQGHCVSVGEQNAEEKNIIMDGNDFSLGSIDTIDDNTTGTEGIVFGTTNIATVV